MNDTLVAPVRIKLCGRFVVERDGAELADRALGSRKGRLLLQLLATERGRLVSTERIADVLWAEQQPRDAAANVATLVSRLRSVLGDDVIAGSRSAYGLLPGGAWSTDLDTARDLLAEASARIKADEPGLALMAASRANDVLGRHEGLDQQPPDDWVVAVRGEIRALRRTARHLGSLSAVRTGDHPTARALAQAAVADDPLDEQGARDLMVALAADGESGSALAVYADLQRTLRRELGVDPHRDTREVHLAVLRGGQPAADPRGRDHPRSTDADRLLGRADELAQLTAAWAAAASGNPSLTLVVGEAGIGKSRLLAEVQSLARSTGGLVLTARCHASERSLFLQPVVEALRPELATLRPASLVELAGPYSDGLVTLWPQLSAALPGSPSRGGAPRGLEAERRTAYEAVAHVLTRLSRDRPVLLALDDAQDAGLATVDLLDYLSRHLGATRVLIVAAARSEEGRTLLDRTGQRRVVSLGPLPASAVAAMAAAAGHADQAAVLTTRTRGHPFSVVEMLRALVAGESGIPPSLAQAVLARVSRAGADAEATVQAAAVLGTNVDPVQLAGLLDVSELGVVGRCEGLVEARLMTRAGLGYEFANDLVQEAVYDALPYPRRIAYHRRAADLLVEHPEAMAHHADAIGDWARAARGWLLAGEEAVRRCAAGDAVELLDLARASADRASAPDLSSRILLVRASAKEALTDYRGALVDLDESLALARAAGDRRLEMAGLRARGGDVPVALHHPSSEWGVHLQTGLAIATELGDRRAEADFSGRLAVLHSSRLRFDEAGSYARRAAAAGHAAKDDRALALGLDGLKTVHSHLGDGGSLRTVLDELEPLLRRLGDTWLLQWCVFDSSFIALAEGDVETARRRIDDAIEVNEQAGYPAYRSFFLAHRGRLARLAGDLDSALADGRRAAEQAEAVEHPWWIATTSGLYAATLLEAGRPAEAAEIADRGWQQVRGHAAEAYVLLSLAPLAEATGHAERLAEADAMLAAVAAPAGKCWVFGADAYLCVARAHLARGEDQLARDAVAPLLRATAPQHWPAVHDAARRVLEPIGPA